MSVRVIGMDRVQARLKAIDGAYRPALAEAAAHIKRVASTYPPVRKQRQPFKSDRQRRFFFAALRDGLIKIGQRTGLLGKLWTVIFRDGGQSAIVGNNAPHGPWVMSTDRQALYHRGNWKTEREIAQEESGAVRQIFARHYARATGR